MKIEIRKQNDNSEFIDEIVISDNKGNVIFHLESMNRLNIWYAIYDKNKEYHGRIYTKDSPIYVTSDEE